MSRMPAARPSDSISLVRFQSGDELAVFEMFGEIARDPTSRHFHPHPFDRDNAVRVCSGSGRDLYCGLWVEGVPRGYGMLRGWDEAFEVPSLGIWVSPRLRGTGAARTLMAFLHLAARLSGSPRIRLKVYPDNVAALALYRSLGYEFQWPPESDGQLLGILELGHGANHLSQSP